ncbi:Nas2p Ecym_4498 [Eremothecium cymbalariae DBVPG|uniref:Probable 26S proteasome regulatory subunit p27 n=1 Tax=Eremothecium cymbalariae (strain CBS 270.75 / DBVPG 7215 / KCTC 17166 / NRRL Y-17582) TaxID=931890 RepID=G8JU34_ERECY|nr:hypothetical protein Ecym_4498 [Eremothecium cymbalariae DBVPG\
MVKNEFDVVADDLDRLTLDPKLHSLIASYATLEPSDLFALKQAIEEELLRLFHMLQDQHKCDLTSPLITPEGFPRSDVDVLQIRLLRRNINMLRNDLKMVIERCEIVLPRQLQQQQQEQQETPRSKSKIPEATIPFAVVTEVTPNSPSSLAGILSGDKIVTISNIHAGNHQKLAAVGPVVKKHERHKLPLRVLRTDGSFHDLILVPSKWAGPGLLGCRLSEL